MTAACPACAAAPAAVELAQRPNTVQLSVPALRCAACISAIENALRKLEGVDDARVNLSKKRVAVQTDRPMAHLQAALDRIGYEAFPLDANIVDSDTDPVGRNLLLRLGIAGFAMMNVMLLSVAVWSGAEGATRDLFHLISAAIALPCLLFSAQPFFKSAADALGGRRLNMDVPIALAILLAAGMSLFEALEGGAHAYFDAALSLTFFLLIGRYLEHRTRAAARSAAKELSALEVHTAQRVGQSGQETVPVHQLEVGDTLLVQTGMRIPVDGTLLSQLGQTDRSFLTGESEPVTNKKGAVLHAGEINLGAPFRIRATAVGEQTRLQQIARLVDTAENARNKYTSLADRAARIYAPMVHLLAFVTFVGWLVAGADVRQALNIAIAVLIITCPCALGLAVPAVSTAAIAKLYKLGLLVKSGTALERLAEVRTVVLDKTGTLTMPGLEVDAGHLTPAQQRVSKALADHSAHPVSRALSAKLEGVIPAEVKEVQEIAGKGVIGIFDGQQVALGRTGRLGGNSQGLSLRIGDTCTPIPTSERLRDGVDRMVADLKRSGYALEIMSGDTDAKTKQLAHALSISRFQAGMTPEQKTDRIARLTECAETPCMIGDGINDTVALAQAHASIAPGTALDAARSAADIVVISPDLKGVPQLFRVAKAAVRLSRQNFGIALAYNAVAIPIAVSGLATPLMAALAMSLSSITVLLNAMRVGQTS